MAQQKSKHELDEQIEENLKRVYQKTLEEEIPDRFMELIEQLKQQDAQNDH
ncbi:NepR family anti-sigma factor [Celeribacter sp. ULVN23_4]